MLTVPNKYRTNKSYTELSAMERSTYDRLAELLYIRIDELENTDLQGAINLLAYAMEVDRTLLKEVYNDLVQTSYDVE